MARPYNIKTAAEMETRIDAYFDECEQKKVPPTVTGLALYLGFRSRQALLNYQGRKQFNDSVTRAKTRCEAYAESRLYDHEGVRGAMFSLSNNFKGWADKPEKQAEDGGVTIVDDIP